jgi:hypothetical protein
MKLVAKLKKDWHKVEFRKKKMILQYVLAMWHTAKLYSLKLALKNSLQR